MKNLMFKYGFLLTIVFCTIVSYGQKNRNLPDVPSKLVAAIQSGMLNDFEKAAVDLKNPNAFADKKKKHTLLTLSVSLGRVDMVARLLQMGADPNLQVQDKSPLLIAVAANQLAIARRLLDQGADPNLADQHGRVPLHYLMPHWNTNMARLLIEHGAQANVVDKKGRSVFTQLNPEKYPVLDSFLRSKAQIQGASAMWPSMHDGPYVFDVDSNVVQVSWFCHDSLRKKTYRRDTFLCSTNQSRFFNKTSKTWQPLAMERIQSVDPEEVDASDTIAVVGDVHGRFIELTALLSGSGVTDKEHNWSFGSNTLVFIGDLVDRGEMVTETLWLVHNLTLQAAEAGGSVVYVLGNHEELMMVGDITYVNEKYQLLWRYFDLNLTDLFSYKTYLGRWVRTRPALRTISRNLFVHAGISKELLDSGLDEAAINQAITQFLTDKNPVVNDTNRLLLLDKGPLWSRTYFKSYDTNNSMSDSLVQVTMNRFGVDRIVIGHTEVPDLMTLFNGKVVTTNVPFYDVQSSRLLLIVGNSLFRVYADGKKEEISTDLF